MENFIFCAVNSALFLCTFSLYFTEAIYIFSCSTLFMLRFFQTAPFPCYNFLCSNLFMLHFFWCVTLFMYCAISYCTFSQCFRFAFFSCYTLCCMLHFFPVALSSCCTISEVKPGLPQTSKMESFATINETVKCCFTTLHLRCSRGSHYASTISMMRFFHATLFITIFMFRSNGCFCMLHFFNIEKY